jgi:hypothetical protein
MSYETYLSTFEHTEPEDETKDWDLVPSSFGHYRLNRAGVSNGIYFRSWEAKTLVKKLQKFIEDTNL